MDYQFIVISASESRKTKTLELLSKVNIKNKAVHVLGASVPENSANYLADCDRLHIMKKREICCSRSHLRALEYASLDSSPEFSVILEDDANFYKDGFCDIIEELIQKWRTDYADNHEVKLINLGWIPRHKFDEYVNDTNWIFKPKLELNNGTHFLGRMAMWGTQGYIVWKRFLADKMHIIRAPTYRTYCVQMLAYIHPKFRELIEPKDPANEVIPIDWAYPYLFYTPAVLFPPIVIERFNEVSMLSHQNVNNFWKPFYAGHESELQKFF